MCEKRETCVNERLRVPCEEVIIRTDVMYRRVPPVFDHEVGVRAYDLHRQAQAAEGEGNHMEAMRLYRHCRRLCPEYADFVGMS